MENVKELKVTSLSDLQSYSKGSVVELPEFAEGQPLIARMKRPSMLVMVKEGKIPNSLLKSANEIFKDGVGSFDKDNDDAMSELYDVIDIICEASLIEPTLSDIREAGLELTDEQMMAIFSYAQQGVEALKSFRKE